MTLCLRRQSIGRRHFAIIANGTQIGRAAKMGNYWIAYAGGAAIGGRLFLADAERLLLDRAVSLGEVGE